MNYLTTFFSKLKFTILKFQYILKFTIHKFRVSMNQDKDIKVEVRKEIEMKARAFFNRILCWVFGLASPFAWV